MSQCAFGGDATVTFEPGNPVFVVRPWGMGSRRCPESACTESVPPVCAGAGDLHAACRIVIEARTGTVGGERDCASIAVPGIRAAAPAPRMCAAVR